MQGLNRERKEMDSKIEGERRALASLMKIPRRASVEVRDNVHTDVGRKCSRGYTVQYAPTMISAPPVTARMDTNTRWKNSTPHRMHPDRGQARAAYRKSYKLHQLSPQSAARQDNHSLNS